VSLSLIAGPANAGKVELLLGRYLDSLDRDPVLIVPTGSDVERVERQLLAAKPCLLRGRIGTFDDVFAGIAAGERSLIGRAQRALLVRRVVAAARLGKLAASARFGGFADALLQTLGELESGLLDPEQLGGELAELYAAYRGELDARGLWDPDLLRRRAVERLRTDLDAWHGEPVFAYGFEDLTGAEWALLEGLAGRAEVSVSLPYEPGRPAFASLRRTAEDLQRLAGANVLELPPRAGEVAEPALAHLERALFSEQRPEPAANDGAVRWFEGAGARGALELVGEELLSLIRAGTPPERIGIVVPSVERLRAPLETALGTLGIHYSIDGELRLAQAPFGHALVSLVRFAWLGGGRRDLFTFLRSPFSGLERRSVDFVEGRLRGRAIAQPDRVLEESEKLRGGGLPILDELRAADDPVGAIRSLAAKMLRNAYDPERPPVGETSRLDLRAYESVTRLLAELERWDAVTREEVASSLERHTLRLLRGDEPGRVAVVDLLRGRTRRFDVVFVLGLEEGSLPRRGGASPFLDDDVR
jgi:ATP-dependent helicase/DNAse subunit B